MVAAEDAAAGKDGGEEWPVDHEWVQIPILYNRTTSGDLEAHIARTARDRLKTFVAGKAEAPADLVRAIRAEVAEASRADVPQCREEAAEVSKEEAPKCRVEAAEVSRAEAPEASKVEVVET